MMTQKPFSLVLGTHVQNVLSWLREGNAIRREQLKPQLDRSLEELKAFPYEEMSLADHEALRAMESFLDSLQTNVANNPYRESVKNKIMARFRQQNSAAGHVIPPNWFVTVLRPSLNPKEDGELQAALNELEQEGLIEAKGQSIAITQKGVDLIY